ncbi:MAG: ATP-dependent Clp protease ATP-binding subunit [Ruminococcaceae bacterium]|nr:ATP-dependent Clp protease ATP-binding subunit [Oscillospiraceae bacterium]
MHNKFTQKAQNTLKNAAKEAGELGHPYIGSEHILLGLCSEKESIAARILSLRGISHATVRTSIVQISGEGERCEPTGADMTPESKRIIEESGKLAKKRGCTYVGTEHILGALLTTEGCMALKLIEAAGISPSLLINDLGSGRGTSSLAHEEKETEAAPTKQKSRTSALLSLYSRDMTSLAAGGKTDPTVGRDAETERVIQILSRKTKNNPCLIGEPGVGKTAIVEGLAARIAEGLVPASLASARILSIDIPSMIAGAKYRGEFEDRMKGVIAEAQKSPDVILFIDEIHVIVGAGAAEGAVDAANILKPSLARGEIRLIGATTPDEYRKHIEKDAALERRFQSVLVEEPSIPAAIDILRGLRPRYEEHHGIKISDGAIEAAVKLSARYVSDRFLPDKAIDVIDEAAAKCNLSQKPQKSGKHITLTEKMIAEVLTTQTGIPTSRLLGGEKASIVKLREELAKKVIGQDSAIEALTSVIRRAKAGLRDPQRPMGSFIFLGNTGVGKTLLATSLAEELLGSRRALIRFDMSEYIEKQSVSKLIGSPPGYVGFGEGGQLTEKVRRRPYCVLLFDEIEKAHADVFDLLLQILEDGRLCDASGREVDFRNCVIIMTSNLGTTDACRITGFSSANGNSAKKEQMNEALKRHFRPEFLERVDEIVFFEELDERSLKKIADRSLCELSARAADIGYKVEFDASVSASLAKQAIRSSKGARALRRLIRNTAEDIICKMLLDGTLDSRATTVFTASIGEDGIKIYPLPSLQAVK